MGSKIGWKIALYAAIGTQISQLRAKSGMSRAQVAERLGCSPAVLENIEQGQMTTPVYVLVQLAHLWDVTLDTLVPVGEVLLKPGVEPKEIASGQD